MRHSDSVARRFELEVPLGQREDQGFTAPHDGAELPLRLAGAGWLRVGLRIRWGPAGPGWTLPHRQPVDRAGRAVEALTPHVQINHRGDETGVPQQLADRQQIDSRFEHARGVRMPQRVRRDDGLDPGQRRRQTACFLNRGRRERHVRCPPREKIVVGAADLPVFSQGVEQSWRGGHAPFFAPFSGSNADLSPLTVDVGDFQMRRFGEPQPRRVTRQQNGPMFGILGAFDQPRGFLIGQHDGQFLGSFAEGDVLDGPRLAEGHFIQKA